MLADVSFTELIPAITPFGRNFFIWLNKYCPNKKPAMPARLFNKFWGN